MWLIRETIKDAASPRGTLYINLNSDKSMNPYTWGPPINWSGFINGKAVAFTQISQYASDKDDFDWSGFPEELTYYQSEIVRLIDEKMKIMD